MDATPGIFIHRNGAQFGPYAPEDVKRYLRSGNLLPTDLGWESRRAAWVPLGDWTEFQGAEKTEAIPPIFLSPYSSPMRLRRQPAVLVLMTVVWWVAFDLVASILFVKSCAPSTPPAAIGLETVLPHLIIFLVTFLLAVWLAHRGFLPGTRKKRLRR